MPDCSNNRCGSCCGGSCSPGGCPVRLTEEEVAFLSRFREAPFLPLSRSLDGENPIYIDGGKTESELLTWLRLKGLVSLDYDIPLTNYDYAEYARYRVRGSMALTARGQDVLDSLDIQGAEE